MARNLKTISVSATFESVVLKVILFVFIVFIPLKDSIFEIFNGLIGIIFIYLIIRNRDLSALFKRKKANTVCILLFVSMTISNFLGTPGIYGWEKQIQFFYRYVLLFYAVLYFLEKDYITTEFIFIAAIIALGIQACDGLYQYKYGTDFLKNRLSWDHRLTAAVHNPNPFGFLMMIGSLSLLDLLRRIRFNKENMSIFLAIISFLLLFSFCLLHSGSRSSLLGFVVGMLIYGGLTYRQLLNLKGLYIIGFLLIFTSFFIWGSDDSILQRISDSLHGDSGDRFDFWQGAVIYIAQRPIFGHGIQEKLVFHILGSTEVTSPHSAYLEIAVYLGIAGSAIYAFILFTAIKYALLLSDKKPIFLIILAGIFVSSFFDNTFLTSQILLSTGCLILSCLFFEYEKGNR
jgi:O-antigen ligase